MDNVCVIKFSIIAAVAATLCNCKPVAELQPALQVEEAQVSAPPSVSVAPVRQELVDVAGKHQALIEAARSQIGVTVSYDPGYVGIDYPNGDVPSDRGVCTDVVIRAMRQAWRMDLQKVVHEDMKKSFSSYPKIWGLKRPDKNIDHRRVPNLRVYFKRQGWKKSVTAKKADYLPGDVVVSHVAGRLPHVMIVSDRFASDGTPLVIHNIGRGTAEENTLFTYPIKAHYRIP